MLPKDEELAASGGQAAEHSRKFKVGATKDGKIIACQREFHVNTGSNPERQDLWRRGRRRSLGALSARRSQLGGERLSLSHEYAAARRLAQQLPAGVQVELGTDDGRDGRSLQHGPDEVPAAESAEARDQDRASGRAARRSLRCRRWRTAFLTYDCYAGVEVLEEGAKVIGWERRNPVAGRQPGQV